MAPQARIAAFWRLHQAGCFVLPNPWDEGTAKLLESLGFAALATSSAALAFARGLPDTPTSLSLEVTLENLRAVVGATELPVNADFQTGFGTTPDEVSESVRRCVETGVAGLSIEDATGEASQPLFELADALERLEAARSAIDASASTPASRVVLTARSEAFLVGDPTPLRTVIERLTAFADAGADCLYAPGLETPEQVAQVVAAVAPKPVNVLASQPDWMSLASLADLGVRRISVGSAWTRLAWKALRTAGEAIALGKFECLAEAEPFSVLNGLFSDDVCAPRERPRDDVDGPWRYSGGTSTQNQPRRSPALNPVA